VDLVRQEGLASMYSGLMPACIRHLVYSGSRVMIYEQLREHVFKKDEHGKFALWKGMLCGMAAGAMGQFVAVPTDLVKVQMQLDGKRIAAGAKPKFTGFFNALATIYKQGGVKGMWRGWVPTVQRAALVQLGDLTTYDYAKHKFMDELHVKDGPALHAMSSAVAGLVAATMGAPADVIKTRFMNQPLDDAGRGVYYKSSMQCLKMTVREEGFMALYKGWLPTWMRMAPWSLCFFLTFEQLRAAAGLSSF